jgi:hypothetical protein
MKMTCGGIKKRLLCSYRLQWVEKHSQKKVEQNVEQQQREKKSFFLSSSHRTIFIEGIYQSDTIRWNRRSRLLRVCVCLKPKVKQLFFISLIRLVPMVNEKKSCDVIPYPILIWNGAIFILTRKLWAAGEIWVFLLPPTATESWRRLEWRRRKVVANLLTLSFRIMWNTSWMYKRKSSIFPCERIFFSRFSPSQVLSDSNSIHFRAQKITFHSRSFGGG